MDQSALSVLSDRIGYRFSDITLLQSALTHRSAGSANNERLEFLGDAALNFVIADELYRRYPDMQEGDLSRLRASLVNGDSLAKIGNELSLGDHVVLGSGEKRSGGHRRDSILADCVESIIGAVYCDSDFRSCSELILRLYVDRLEDEPDLQSLKDPKTRLQEMLQSRRHGLPEYEVIAVTGKAHQQSFEVRCTVSSLQIETRGNGRSRRRAEQHAATAAIELIRERTEEDV